MSKSFIINGETVTTNRPFRIDGVAIPTPSTYSYSTEDLSSEETGRTLDGIMHKDVVSSKDVFDCTWKRLSWADTATLMNAIHGKTKVQFTHANPRTANQFITKWFYIGQRTGSALDLSDPKKKHSWTDIAFSFIEI